MPKLAQHNLRYKKKYGEIKLQYCHSIIYLMAISKISLRNSPKDFLIRFHFLHGFVFRKF